MATEYIDIPLDSGSGGVRFFPDELPADHVDLIDVLRAEIPPLKTWKLCAVEYFKQGEEDAFQNILDDVVSSIDQGSVDKYAKSQQDNPEAIADINIARAAKELWTMVKLKNQPNSNQHTEAYESSLRRFIELERSVNKLNEFIWLIKGFVQIVQGDLKGAEDNFRQVYETATKLYIANKKKYLFGSLIGKGLLDYHNKRFSSALENFSKALMIKPDFDVSLKFILSLCFYRVGQMERAKIALERSLQQGVGVNQLILLALIELDNAKGSDQERQFQCQQKFYDYLMIAYSLDKFNPMVLNLLANHSFNTWKTIQGLHSTQLCEPTKIITADSKVTSVVEVGSTIRIERKEYSIINLSESANSLSIILSQPIQNVELPIEIADLDIKDYKTAKDFAQRAARFSTIPIIRAESYYILGKIAQAQKRFKLAYDFYKRSSDESNEMTLAYFGAAQVLFALGDYGTALDLFEKIKASSSLPDDRDTQAYIWLLRGIVKGELAPIDVLKEVAPGFAFEFELWLSQGQLRLKKQSDHSTGLKCLLSAESILKQKCMPVPFDLLLNISTLYQYQGNYVDSKKYACFAMHTFHGVADVPREFLLYREFENFYYRWSESVGTAVQSSTDNHCFRLQMPVTKQHLLEVGADVRINGVIWTIRTILSKEEIVADTLFGGALHISSEPAEFQVKLSNNNFSDSTILCSYNYARALEEESKVQAASTLYKHILNRHPSFIDAYIRLSSISRSLNKIADSKFWLQKAKLCKDDHSDFDVMMSDLYLASEEHDRAKEILTSSYLKNRTDAQILVANGNFYLDVFNRKKNDEGQLKLSYKYFHPALQDHIRNIYAAHGLGIVCALKGELEAGYSILDKIRNSTSVKKTTSNLNLNLAYINLLQQRYPDADRHLNPMYRDLVLNSDPIEVGRCLGLMSVVQYHNHHQDESIRSALKYLHLNPMNLLMWYNVGVSALVATKHEAQGSLFSRLDRVFANLNGSAAFKSIDSSDVRLAQKLLHNKKRKYEQESGEKGSLL